MTRRILGIPAFLAISLSVNGCGSSSSASSATGPVTRHHDSYSFTVKWLNSPVEFKPMKATLKISPASSGVIPSTGIMDMPSMHMVPAKMHWHEVKAGLYRGSTIPTMGGLWNLNVTFHHGGKQWQEAFPINVRN